MVFKKKRKTEKLSQWDFVFKESWSRILFMLLNMNTHIHTKYLYLYLNINKSHQQMLKQVEIDCEKNIIFGYCSKGTTSVKKESEHL